MKKDVSRIRIVLEILCLLMVVATVIYTIRAWSTIPNEIPIHFDINGVADRTGSKNTIVFFVLFELGFYIFLTAVIFFPNRWNIPFIDKKNKELSLQGEKLTSKLIFALKFEVLLICSYILYHMIMAVSLPTAFLWLALAAIAATFVIYVLRLRKLRSIA